MKTQRIIILLAAALAVSARAQSSDPAAASAAPAAAPAVTAPAPAAAPNQIVYTPRLPAVNELTAAAAAQHLTIARIEQTATQVTVVYLSASGGTNIVAYQLLPSAGSPATAASPVVYQAAPEVIYCDGYAPGYYAPLDWYPPVSLQLGFGYRVGGYRHWR